MQTAILVGLVVYALIATWCAVSFGRTLLQFRAALYATREVFAMTLASAGWARHAHIIAGHVVSGTADMRRMPEAAASARIEERWTKTFGYDIDPGRETPEVHDDAMDAIDAMIREFLDLERDIDSPEDAAALDAQLADMFERYATPDAVLAATPITDEEA